MRNLGKARDRRYIDKLTEVEAGRRPSTDLIPERELDKSKFIISDAACSIRSDKEAKKFVESLGCTFSKKDGEYRINLKGAGESSAYYTDDRADAITTAETMARPKVQASNVYDYFQQVLKRKPKSDPGPRGLKEYPIDSHCGEMCKQIIDKTRELLDMCDTHPHVVDNIIAGAETAVEIVCFG